MTRRWKIKDEWIIPLIFVGGLGWLPACIIGQVAPVGSMSRPPGWGFWGAIAVWFGLPILTLTVACIPGLVRWMVRVGMPVERVTEPITTDMRKHYAQDDR